MTPRIHTSGLGCSSNGMTSLQAERAEAKFERSPIWSAVEACVLWLAIVTIAGFCWAVFA